MQNCNFKVKFATLDGNTAVDQNMHAVSPIMTNETEDHILSPDKI